jgi:hypothetical protein
MRGMQHRIIALGLAILLLIAAALAGPIARAQEGVCDSAPVPRLEIGGWAQITEVVRSVPAGGLRMRADARTTADEVTVMPAGTVVRVVDGSACNDGFVWWYLRTTDGFEGWSAEGFGELYYLVPISDALAQQLTGGTTALQPTATPIPAEALGLVTATSAAPAGDATGEDCPGVLEASYLSTGAAARVADQAHPVRIRQEPATDSLFLQLAYQDAVLTVIGGPTCADDLRWWQVDVGGRTGWTVESANGRYLLIDPANPPPDIEFAVAMSQAPPPPTATPPLDVTPVPTPRPTNPPGVYKRAAFSLDGGLLAVGAGDGLRVYESAGYTLLNTVTTSPVIDFVVVDGALHAVTWAPEGIRVIRVADGTIRTILTNAPYDPAWAAAAPNGQWLILGPTSDGSTATLWDMNSAAPPQVDPYWWPGWGVVNAAFSPDNTYVIINDIVYIRSCQVDGTGCLFDLVRNDFLASGIMGDMRWSGDGAWMAGFSDRFWLWDGNVLGVGFTLQSTLTVSVTRRVALNTNGTRGAVLSGRLMELWNLEQGAYVANRVVQMPGDTHSLAFKPDGSQLVAAVGDSVLVYDPISGGLLQQVE